MTVVLARAPASCGSCPWQTKIRQLCPPPFIISYLPWAIDPNRYPFERLVDDRKTWTGRFLYISKASQMKKETLYRASTFSGRKGKESLGAYRLKVCRST
jgi:hypothetical protein